MRRKMPAAVLLALALLIPATPALAKTASPAVTSSCATVQYADIRSLFTIDLATASTTDVRVLANQILSVANAEALATLPARIQQHLDGTPADLRTFLESEVQADWSTDLRVATVRTLAGGTNVKAAAQAALDDGTVDVLLAYLNDGLYLARARDAGSFASYADIRALITIDLDTASDTDVRVLANQILSVATAEALTTLPARIQQQLDGAPADLRTFLKTKVQTVWSIDLRIAINRTLAGGGTNVKAAAQVALDNGTVDVFLAYLNHGLYLARAQDCAI